MEVSNYSCYHDLMPNRVKNILVVSSPYDAFIMEQDGGLLEHVFMQVRGISLVEPPRFTVVSSGDEAFEILGLKKFDLVLSMPRYLDKEKTIIFAKAIKEIQLVPVVLMVRSAKELSHKVKNYPKDIIDNVFMWSGNRSVLWSVLKWCEDRMNAEHDTQLADVRTIIVIEDSPYYYSSLLPMLYRSIVKQTQAVMDDTLSDEHRLVKLRARTKILLATDYEEAEVLYKKFRPYLLGIVSDTRFPRAGEVDAEAGIKFLKMVKKDMPELPLLLTSTEGINREKAKEIPARFQDKNSAHLHKELRKFLVSNMGFGDFIFRLPSGEEVVRASNFKAMEKALKHVPKECLLYHSMQNHFSNWFFARAEVELASYFRAMNPHEFDSPEEIRKCLVQALRDHRKQRQRGIIAEFNSGEFDFDSVFSKMGEGSLGGKARGLAFMSRYLNENIHRFDEYQNVSVSLPKTVVIGAEYFDEYVEENDLYDLSEHAFTNKEIALKFSKGRLPETLAADLRELLEVADYPLAVRSSSLLEDSQEQPFAGLYATYMLPNNDQDFDERFFQLAHAVKMVYASTYFEAPKAFSRTTKHRTEEEKMAVVIQQVVGDVYGEYFYPLLSGTAQSHNFYPLNFMKAEEGVTQISMGLGKIVVEGGQTIRFSPKFPKKIVQFSSAIDTVQSSQKQFYCLRMTGGTSTGAWVDEDVTLIKRDVSDAKNETPFYLIASTYEANNARVRDSFDGKGIPILTFASILKYGEFPLAQVIETMLDIGKRGFGCDIEIEFAVNLNQNYLESGGKKWEFVLLQARPMITADDGLDVSISNNEIEKSMCYSTNALGRGVSKDITDIIYLDPEHFNSINSMNIIPEISKLNAELEKEDRKYLLVGPGRWGSSDHCLGVSVQWNDISSVGGIIEAATSDFRPDPSQGTHFFQNITSLGIAYFTVHNREDQLDWDWFKNCDDEADFKFIKHIRLEKPITIKVDGKKNAGVVIIN
ncbi:MAG: hypothetical protein KAG61_07625 [Bacteriovoracaceae bacterium]|nr:hypothetical protein [Bacteriovoracaceae bacterium]